MAATEKEGVLETTQAMYGSSVDPWDHAGGEEGGEQRVESAEDQGDDVSSRKLFVGNIGYRQNWRDLKDFFSKFGKVAYTQVVFDHLKKRSKGFGFVEFATKEGADKCRIAPPEELVLHGRKLRLNYANESEKSTFKIHPPVPDLSSGKETSDEQTGGDKSAMLTMDEWRIIFSYLTIPELVRVERVCRKWRETALQLWKERRDLTCRGFSFKNLLTDKVLMSLLNRCCGLLRSLNLFTVSQVLTEYSMTIVGHHCPGLVKLDMSDVAATNIGLRDLSSQAKGLKWVKLQRCRHVAEKGLWWLFKNCQQLEHVDFAENFAVTGKCFFMLQPNLTCMIANDCYKLTDYGIQQLSKKCCHLRELQIHSCMNLTDDAVRAIATLSELEVLDIGGHFPQATLEPWSLLKNVHNLTELRFDMNCHVTDEAVQAVARGCPKVRYLSLSGCRPHVTSQGLSSLTALKHLTSLNISYILQVNDELLEKLGSKGVLERLWLHTCLDVTETGVQRVLELCSRLTLLDLSNNTSLMTSALSPLTSGLCDMHPERQLEVIIGGTTMLFQEAETGMTSLETGLPSWVTLTRVNRANRHFNDEDMIYLPDPWSDEEAGDDFEEMADLFEEGENAEGQGHLLEGVDVLGGGDKEPERNAERDKVLERNAAEELDVSARKGHAEELEVLARKGHAEELEVLARKGHAEELEVLARKGHAEELDVLARKEQAEARPHALLAEGDNHDGSHFQEKSKSASQERNDSESNTEAKGSNSHVTAEVKKEEEADGVGAVGGGDGGDGLVVRTEVIKDTCPSAAEWEDEESWEGEDVPVPARVPQPAPLPRIGRFQDVGDFDEDYDEFLDNDDPLEFERWEMS